MFNTQGWKWNSEQRTSQRAWHYGVSNGMEKAQKKSNIDV